MLTALHLKQQLPETAIKYNATGLRGYTYFSSTLLCFGLECTLLLLRGEDSTPEAMLCYAHEQEQDVLSKPAHSSLNNMLILDCVFASLGLTSLTR
jgi:hypothetical protein